VWKDGVPVSGSTPKRVAQRLAELEVDEFIDATAGQVDFGLESPRARIELKDADENSRVVRIGGVGEPVVDSEGHTHKRYYVQIEGEASIYLVNAGVLEVVRDLVRESGRKAKKDSEKAARRERIESTVEQ
jgi:hypothetical protein